MECQDAKLEGKRSKSVHGRWTVGRILALLGVALLVLTANVVASILYMVVYGHVIDPGHDPKYYEAHIQVAGPYCSIVAGIPISIFAGWWVAGWWQRSLKHLGAICVWLAYTIIDFLVLVIVGMSLESRCCSPFHSRRNWRQSTGGLPCDYAARKNRKNRRVSIAFMVITESSRHKMDNAPAERLYSQLEEWLGSNFHRIA